MKNVLTFLILLMVSISIVSSQDIIENEDLQRISFYPKNADDYYFNPIIDMEILDDYVYGVENLSHKVIAFKIEFPQIKYDSDIGNHGQGPGGVRRDDSQVPLERQDRRCGLLVRRDPQGVPGPERAGGEVV